ncbi:sensor histidine kinase [Streptomyces sp. HNM0663]|uniref:histidine kinase n=1 Tax=Streptomyces chengmaiensis TaxID=3040919 RepID=A0ABT6HPA6_9ACTN|nr:sensor histidine kinase [Streptomyces chengmaiensis]MDH2390552.1 sensor histidine kinase [Streptomyces chengmaiensis]
MNRLALIVSWGSGLPARTVDAWLAAVAVAVVVSERLTTTPSLGVRLLSAVVLAAVIGGSLAARRRMPVTGYAAGTAALAVEALWVTPGALSPMANLIGLYCVGYYATPRHTLWGPVIALPGIAAYFVGDDVPPSPAVPAAVVVVWLLTWAIGYAGARRRERQANDRRLMSRDAVIDERNRIARELHDVVGHTMSVMLVQSGAARVVLGDDPDKAREILAGVERAGREAFDELDRVLGLLRRDDGVDLHPGLVELPRLVRRTAEAGLDVTVRVDPPQPRLPGSIDLSAYRIVQEALTNAFRHGKAASATVAVRCGGRSVEVEVQDDGRGPQPGYQPGRGLLGISERVAVFGGCVEHGKGDGGGFRLRAVLPLPRTGESA